MPALGDIVNWELPEDDRIDNKRIVRSAVGGLANQKEVCSMSIVSPGLRLALVAAASVIASALLGGCPWGP
jgi:hypothetical protein